MAKPKNPTVLFLASWYPTPLKKSHGIFIKNHGLALSKFVNVAVVYAYANPIAKGYTVHKGIDKNFTEYLVEYKKVTSNIPIISKLQTFYRFKKAYKLLLQTLIKDEVNVVGIQVNVVFPAAIALPIFKKYYKVKHTIFEHWSGYLPEDGNYKGFLIKQFTKKAFTKVSKIFYVSELQKSAMKMHGLNGNYQLIYNVVNTEVFNYTNLLKSSTPLFLHVSSLDINEKNILGTLTVLKNLQIKNYTFQSVFVGGKDVSIKQFEDTAKQLSIKNINFVGHKTQAQIAELMQQAHALILFSNYENMPVVVLEALACGLPIFATKVGQLPFFITDNFGRLVDVKNEEQLTEQLKLFLDNKLQFDSEKMIKFINSHATFEVVGKKLAETYLS